MISLNSRSLKSRKKKRIEPILISVNEFFFAYILKMYIYTNILYNYIPCPGIKTCTEKKIHTFVHADTCTDIMLVFKHKISGNFCKYFNYQSITAVT